MASFVASLDPTIEEISDIKTAVSEAVTNAIIHGYENSKGIVTIKSRLKEKTIEIEIIDNGKGIEDVEKAKEPLFTTKPEVMAIGYGLYKRMGFNEDAFEDGVAHMSMELEYIDGN